jgi:hypothetical protein
MSLTNETDMLDYVKGRLGFPYNPIELKDDELLNIIIRKARREFSKYYPVEYLVDLTDSNRVGPAISNIYQLTLPEGQELLSIRKIIDYNNSSLKAYTRYSNKELSFNYFDNDIINDIETDHISYKILPNNQVQVLSGATARMTAICNIEHAMDFSTVTSQNHVEALEEFALGEVCIRLFSVRSMYSTVNTPLGEINLNLDFLRERIEEYKTFKENIAKAAALNRINPVYVV